MATDFNLPELGEGIDKVEVSRVLVAPGDRVEAEQPVVEVETDKAAMELPSPCAGVIEAVSVNVGDEVAVGATLMTITADESEAVVSPSAPEPPVEPAAPVEPPAEQTPAAPPPAAEETKASAPSPIEPPTADGPPPPAGPATRRLARELGVDLRLVSGTGARGRITPDDVRNFVREQVKTPTGGVAVVTGDIEALALPDFERWGSVERQPFRSVRRKTAAHVSLSWSQIPHVTQHDEADITELEAFRRRYRDEVEAAGGKLTALIFALKACGMALREFPQFNASLDLANEQIVLKDYCHIGIAVDTPRGLLAPVIRDVDGKSLLQLAAEVAQLAERTRQGQIKPDELQGGCFTITNLGGIGGAAFTPIVNFPEVAILGLSRGKPAPRPAEDGGVEWRTMLPLSLSYDHRVIDGADGARFTRYIAELLENPGRLFLSV